MSNDPVDTEDHMDRLHRAIDRQATDQIWRLLNNTMVPAEVAHALESSPPREREELWTQVGPETQGEVLLYLSEEVQDEFLDRMDAAELLTATENLDTDDLADLLQRLPTSSIQQVLDSMEAQERERVETVLSYPEDTAGGLMDTDTITIRPNITLDVVLRYIRRHEELPQSTDVLWVVTRRDELIGRLSINKLLVCDPSMSVREIMDTDFIRLDALASQNDVAQLFERHDLISAPVLNERGQLVGRITIDDVVDVIRDSAEHTVMSMAGLDEEDDTFAPALRTTRRRAIWLGINLLTAFLASSVIGMFEGTIQKITALAVLMPIVASMGGIAGSQTLTVLIRGIALGHVKTNNVRWLLGREMIAGMLNGVLWAAVVAALAIVWFDDWMLGGVIALAIVINLVVASLTGTLLPVLLKRLSIDPALSGSVILTTVTDVVGFLSFLGLASVIYL
ncbi:magnesium transporter [Larsenimonas rhizosphaerae]|uniref:Magnesium transporter MgtE n=1 Tax=Larsenimonas rhizosphaerae TaxID=2944682 RepID=A0AA42CTN0_9GAMM|nr:magnesium transporter [Larsenimonas rhizosphaerae]MCM2131087.1 magnesium transporter [Larsenimonas rhizosphaerae]MCX2523792.1 magnesium transporter [Larsenimonas rhizosphaerae]